MNYFINSYLFLVLLLLFPVALLADSVVLDESLLKKTLDSIKSESISFPYREVKYKNNGLEFVALFLPSNISEEILKLSTYRCKKIQLSGIPCRQYIQVDSPTLDKDIDNLVSKLIDNSNNVNIRGGKTKPETQLSVMYEREYALVIVDSDLERMSVDEKAKEEGIDSVLKEVKKVDDGNKTILLKNSGSDKGGYYIYLGEGDFELFNPNVSYYSFLFNSQVSEAKITGADLRFIEAARQEFILAKSKLSKTKMIESEVRELAARLRTLSRVSYAGPICLRCNNSNSFECSKCTKLLVVSDFSSLYEFAFNHRFYSLAYENKLARYIGKDTSISSLYVRSTVNDKLAKSYNQQLDIFGFGSASKTKLPLVLSNYCSGLKTDNLNIVYRLIHIVGSFIKDLRLSSDYEELCVSIKYFQDLEKDESNLVDSCVTSLTIGLSSNNNILLGEAGTLKQDMEIPLVRLCYSVLYHSESGLMNELPISSLSNMSLTPLTSGKYDVLLLLERSKAEEKISISSVTGGEVSTTELIAGGWFYDEKLKLWIRNKEGKVLLPIMVRYVVDESGKLVPISLEGDDKENYKRGINLAYTDPKFSSLYAKIMSELNLVSGDVNCLMEVGKAYHNVTRCELQSAQNNVDLATTEVDVASRNAKDALNKYQEAVDNERKLLKMVEYSEKLKKYHDKKAKKNAREADLKNLKYQLHLAEVERAKAADESAHSLILAAEAEKKRREMVDVLQDYMRKANEAIKDALKVQESLVLQLKSVAKLDAAYEAAIVAEDKLRSELLIAQDTLANLIEEEKQIRNDYDRELNAMLLEEEGLLKQVQELALLKEELEKLRAAILSINETYNKISADSNKLNKETQDLNLKYADAQNRQRLLLEKLNSHKSEMAFASKNIKDLEEQLELMNIDVLTKEEELRLLRIRIDDLLDKLNRARGYYNELVESLSSYEYQLKMIDLEIEDLKKKIAEIDAQLFAIMNELKLLEEERRFLGERAASMSGLDEKERNLYNRLNQLRALKDQKIKEVNALLTDKENLRTDTSALLVSSGTVLNLIQQTLKDLNAARIETNKETIMIKDKYDQSTRDIESNLQKVEQVKNSLLDAKNLEEQASNKLSSTLSDVNQKDLLLSKAHDNYQYLYDQSEISSPITPECGDGYFDCNFVKPFDE